MRRISAVVIFFGALLSVLCTLAAAFGGEPSVAQIPIDQVDSSSVCEAPADAGPCSCRCRGGCCGCGSVGYFNCCCKGSYKFPVPPQSTYFWPGIYSQKTMTAYVSPYRCPSLQSPDVLTNNSNALNKQTLTRSARLPAEATIRAAQ